MQLNLDAWCLGRLQAVGRIVESVVQGVVAPITVHMGLVELDEAGIQLLAQPRAPQATAPELYMSAASP